jgi:hypothetical protein
MASANPYYTKTSGYGMSFADMPGSKSAQVQAAELAASESEATNAEKKREFDVTQQNYQDQVAAQKTAASAVGTGLQSLVNSYNLAFATAKAEGESRYQQMLSIADQTTGQQAADIRTTYANKQSSALQNLAKLGMSNTTIGSTLALGNARSEAAAQNTLADTMQQTKLGIIANKASDASYAPDKSAITSLINSATSNTGAYGTGAAAEALAGLNS